MRSALRPLFAVGDRLGADVTLGVSELVANVVSYTPEGGELRVWLSDPVRVEVHDSSAEPPRLGAADGVGGRGLAIVAALTDGNWGVEVSGSSKFVWAAFSRQV